MFGLGVFMLIYLGFVFFAPNFFGEPDNYIEANPLVTPPHIVPEWYFLPFYAILRAITFDIWFISAKLIGVVAMFGSILILLVLPWLDRSPVRSARFRPLFKRSSGFSYRLLRPGLRWRQPPEGYFVILGQVATAYYFAHFLIIIPLLSFLSGLDRFRRPSAPPSRPRASAFPPGGSQNEEDVVRGRPRRGLGAGAAQALEVTQIPSRSGVSPACSAPSTERSCSAATRSTRKSATPVTACSSSLSVTWKCSASRPIRCRRSPPSSKCKTGRTTRATCSCGRPGRPTVCPRHFRMRRPRAQPIAALFLPICRLSSRRAKAAPITSAPCSSAIATHRRKVSSSARGCTTTSSSGASDRHAAAPVGRPRHLCRRHPGDPGPAIAGCQAFLAWASEPNLEDSKRMGISVLLFLIVLTGLPAALKRQIWSDVH